ncbi:uncharacterized protein LOC110951516 [Acanthochromis polyacanthus]|uniref:uncharacterized protein LOC110951516 n=1 Tax=Acanthochromis polyacanthus TaxID=80966 RepID=UPI002234AA12|nr:uncharacterized protein LOC110951516 [Acanthochromis polyacanthus]
MLLLSVKTYPALLWTICVLFAVESLTAPSPQPSDTNSPVEALTGLYGDKELQATTWKPSHKPAEVGVAAATESAGLPTVETQEANSLNNSRVGLVVMSTAAQTAAETAAASGSDHRLLQTAAAVTTAAGEDQLYSSTDKHAQDQSHQPSATTSNDTTAPAAASAAFTAIVVVSSPQPTSSIEPEVTSQISSTVSSHESTQIFNQSLSTPSASTATTMTTNPTSEAAPVFNPTSMPEKSKPSTHPTSAATVLISTLMSVSTDPPSSTVSNSSAGVLNPRIPKRIPVPTFSPTTPSASTATAMTTNPTSEAAPVLNPTSMPETSKPSTELPSTSHPTSATTVLTSTGAAGSSSTPMSVSTDPPSSTVSNSSAGVLNPRIPKRIPVPTFSPAPATTAAPRHVTNSPSSTETQPCSTRSLVKNCLIVIAALAALATIFMVSTIVLCTKLSAKKYRVKKSQQGTEMMCISALLPEPSYTYTRQRNPVRNGIRVIPGGGDSDDELGDNLTLSSFLPENDRYV